MPRDYRKIGRKKQASGAAFEAWIDAQHVAAKAMGLLGHVEHNQPHSKVINARVVYTACGVADYSLLLPGGIYGAAEAKSIQGDTLLQSLIAPKQTAHLNAVAEAGGVALLLVEFRHEDGRNNRYAIPWKLIPWKVKRTAPSLSEEDAAHWLVRPGKCYLDSFVTGRLEPVRPVMRRFPRE